MANVPVNKALYSRVSFVVSNVQAVVEAIAPTVPDPLSNATEPSSPRKNAMIFAKYTI